MTCKPSRWVLFSWLVSSWESSHLEIVDLGAEFQVPGGERLYLTEAVWGCGKGKRQGLDPQFWSQVPVLLCELQHIP